MFLIFRLSQGHARLMYHTEVEILDAVMAVTLIEASMQGDSSVLGLGFDIHSSSPENPTETYTQLIRTVLCKLNLDDLLQKEIERLQDTNNDEQSTQESLEADKTLYNRFKNMFKKTPTVISKRKSCEFIGEESSKKIKLNSSQDTSTSRNSEDNESLKSTSETNEEVSDVVNESTRDEQTEDNPLEIHKKCNTKNLLAQFKFKPRDTTDSCHSNQENNEDNNKITEEDVCVQNDVNFEHINSKDIEAKADLLSQNTRNKRFFDQHRFKARSALLNEKVDSENLKLNEPETLSDENTTKGFKCNSQLRKTSKTDVFKDFSNIGSTQNSNTCYSQTVFEKQEDYDDLDLELDE